MEVAEAVLFSPPQTQLVTGVLLCNCFTDFLSLREADYPHSRVKHFANYVCDSQRRLFQIFFINFMCTFFAVSF